MNKEHYCYEDSCPDKPQTTSPLSQQQMNTVMNRVQQIRPENVQIQQYIGNGFFGSVYLGEIIGSNPPIKVAVKKIEIPSFRNKTKIELMIREVDILSRLNHERIVKFLGILRTREDEVCIITEYLCLGDLEHFIDRNFNLITPQLKKNFCMDIVEGMTYLHAAKIIHRDLTPKNILLADNMRLKIIDFGLSREVPDRESTGMTMSIGSKMYMAPEVYNESLYSLKADVYSFAMVCYKLWMGKDPCENLNTQDLFLSRVVHDRFRPEMNGMVPNHWQDLVHRCWHQNPAQRLSFEDIGNWLKSLNGF